MMDQALPDGVAETAIAESTAGGTAGAPRESRLLWIVATGTREYVYDVARCGRLQTGEDPGDALAAARCDDSRYVVGRQGDRIELRRDGDVVASLSVPPTWRVRVRSSAP
jgi:hypothetical protein